MAAVDAQVVVLGSINMDLVVPVARFPEAGETVLGQSLVTHPGGKGANQAVAAARQGARVTLIGALGSDSYGESLHAALAAGGVDTRAVKRVRGSSGVAFIPVATDGENRIIVVPGANRTLTPERLDEHADLIARAAFLVMQLEIPLGTVSAAAALTKAGQARIILNASPVPPQGLPDALLAQVDILVVNRGEAEALTGESDVQRAAGTLRARGIPTVIVTLGAAGALLAEGDVITPVAPYSVQAVDNTGAGDAFVGAMAARLAEGAAAAVAVRHAAAAGALAVTRWGAQSSLPTRAAVEALVADAEGRAPQDYPSEREHTFTAPDGEAFIIRPILPADAPRLQRLFRELSAESVYRRFFTVRKELHDSEARDFATVDYHHDFAYVAAPAQEPDHLVAVARFAEGSGRAASVEMAIVVADAFQGRGLGRFLFRQLADTAREEGYRWMMVETQNDNHPMIELAQRAGYQTQTSYDGNFIQIWLRLDGSTDGSERK